MINNFIKKVTRQVKEIGPILFTSLKKEYVGLLLLTIIGIGVIWLGGMVSVIGSRQIVKPVHITVSDVNGKELQSVRVFVGLARAGNAVLTRNDKLHGEQWSIDGVFIEKIMVGATNRDLQRLSKIDIAIGEKNFSFLGTRELARWDHFDKSIVKPYIKDADYDDYTIAEVPSNIRLETSNIPFKKSFFSSLVNWGGDNEVFIKPLADSYGSIILYILFLFIIRVILLVHERKNISVTNNDDATDHHQKQFVVFFLTITSTIASLTLINVLILHFYKPDVTQILKDASTLYLNYQLPAFLPKNVERLQYILSVILSPIILTGFYCIFKRWISCAKVGVIDFLYSKLSIVTICLLLAAAYAGLAMSDFLYVKTSYYFDGLGRYFFDLIIFPALLFVFLTRGDLIESYKKPIKISLQVIFYFIIILILSMSILGLGSTFSAFHLNPIFYPISQVIAGKMLLIDVTSLYGLLPLFLAPIFKIIGFGLFKFSLVMGIILCCSYIFLFMFMRKSIDNYILLYSGFLGVVFYSYLTFSPMSPGYYFQYWPIRLLFPAIFLFIAALYFKEERRSLYYISFFLCALAVLWNLDSGIIVFLSWVIVLTYHEFSKNSSLITKFLKTGSHILYALLSLVMVISVFYLYTHISSGQWPDISLLLQYQKMFLSGYFMIPMLSPPHAWNLVILTYLTGLLLSVAALINKNVDYRNKLIFALSILGIGLFSYYEGRSHDLTLFGPSYPAFILVAIFADKLYTRIKSRSAVLRGDVLIFAFLFYIVISAPFSIVYNVKTYLGYAWSSATSFQQKGDSAYNKNINFIKKYAIKGEGVFILSPHNEGIYYGETGTFSAVDIPSSTDLFFKREADMIVSFLEKNKDVKVFVELPISLYDLYDVRIKKLLETRYSIVSSSGAGLSFLKRN